MCTCRSSKEGVQLESVDADEQRVEAVAAALGLQRIGFVWTDLHVDNKGMLKSSREFGSVPLTSAEILRMAKLQNKHMSPCKQSLTGKYGSKFVSLLVTGTPAGGVEVDAFQVSDQCMALVKDGIITASKNPSLMRVKKSKTRYIPDVMYRTTDEYNNEIIKKAAPTLPSEFFIIRVTSIPVTCHSFLE